MYMTVSKISRKDTINISDVDIDTIMPAIDGYDEFREEIVSLQAAGKIIYRSSSISSRNGISEVETVTLYQNQGDFDAFKVTPVFTAFEANLEAVYNTPVVTEEVV